MVVIKTKKLQLMTRVQKNNKVDKRSSKWTGPRGIYKARTKLRGREKKKGGPTGPKEKRDHFNKLCMLCVSVLGAFSV